MTNTWQDLAYRYLSIRNWCLFFDFICRSICVKCKFCGELPLKSDSYIHIKCKNECTPYIILYTSHTGLNSWFTFLHTTDYFATNYEECEHFKLSEEYIECCRTNEIITKVGDILL